MLAQAQKLVVLILASAVSSQMQLHHDTKVTGPCTCVQEGDALLKGLRKGPWRHADTPSRPCPGFPRPSVTGCAKSEVQPEAGHQARPPAEQSSPLP